jgi:hypothetical protein
MTFPFPARELGADSVEPAHPSGNDSDNIAPFTSLRRHNEIRTPDAGPALDGLLQEILRMPKTNGAAIALDTGDYVECQASRGQSAPPAGTRCYPGIGLTGECLSTGEVQVCNNTDDDSRVDRQACQHLGARSVLVVPIRRGSAVIGVLEALSSEANAFDEQKQSCITNLAEQVGSSAPQSLERTRHNHGTRELPNERPGGPSALVKQTLPSDFDLQEFLQAIYVVQQCEDTVFLADCPAAPYSEIDRANVHGSKPPEAPECAESANQLCAAVSSYSFTLGQETPTKSPRYRSVAIAAIFLAVLFGSYYLASYGKMSRSAQMARVLGPAPGSMGPGLAPEADPPSRQFHGEAQPQPSKSVLAADMPKADKMSRDPLQATNLVRMETQVTSENSNAQYELGAGYPDGKDVPQTYAAAMAQFEETAKKGNADAGWKLGLGYLRGIGVRKDETRAAEWFKKAANLGDVRAQTALSDLYFTGVGVRRDYVRAYTWASIAASGWGNEDERLKDIGKRMTTAQLENANRRTAAWFAQKHTADGQDLR